MLGNALPNVARIGVRRLHDDRAAVDETHERIATEQRRRVVQHHQIDIFQLAVQINVPIGNRQIVRRRQPLLFRAVLGICLHVFAEHVAADRRDHLVRRHRAEAADAVSAHRKRAGLAEIGIFGHLQRQCMIDAHAEIVLPIVDHVFDDRDDVARPHVAAPQSRRAGINLRHAIDFLQTVLPGHGVAKRRLNFARQMIARRR